MSSVSSQQQFRYTQTPSKVLHLRNLPWECTEEELIELGKPFGTVVNTKCNVGANKNQAFIEFEDLNQAIQMISFYASSSEPAQVFSAFGFVHKITTFEKTAGYQALVQFSDAETATSARTSLDGRSIPSYLLPEEVSQCSLKITYSAHTDLTVKFQSHRSRDYTNPYLPVAPSAIDSTGQVIVGVDGRKMEPESNVLLASIENMQYAVTLDVLHTVFVAFGAVQKIAMFDKNGGVQALIQYPDVQTAVVAKGALEGHCIYEGGFCKLHITYSRHTDLSIKVNNDRSRDYTMPDAAVAMAPQPSHNPYPGNSQQYHAAGASHYQQQHQQPQGGWGQSGGQGHDPYMAAPSMHQGPGGHMPPHHYGGGPSGPMH